LNENYPKSTHLINIILNKKASFYFSPIEQRFSIMYSKNLWGSDESVSGRGSTLDQTETIRKKIPILLEKLNAKSLLDIPCGDFNWLSKTELNIEKYIGGDIIPELIAQNKKKYETDGKTFKLMDVTKSKLPKVDVILCRDCLVHLSYKNIFSAIRNFKESKSKYLLSTTFTHGKKNRNIFSGCWRPINLKLPPFNFPKEISIINEGFTKADGSGFDKSLGLWNLEDVRI